MALQQPQTSPNRKQEALQPGDVLVVIRKLAAMIETYSLTKMLRTDDFDARSADELTLRKTERVELVELDDGFGDGWYLGRHLTRGSTGLFPGGTSFTVFPTFPFLTTHSLHYETASQRSAEFCSSCPTLHPHSCSFEFEYCHCAPNISTIQDTGDKTAI